MFFGGLGLPAAVNSSNLAQFPAAISALAPNLSALTGLTGLGGLGGLTGLGGLAGLGGLGGLTGLGGLAGGLGGLGVPNPLVNTFGNQSLVIPFSALNIAPGIAGFGAPFGFAAPFGI